MLSVFDKMTQCYPAILSGIDRYWDFDNCHQPIRHSAHDDDDDDYDDDDDDGDDGDDADGDDDDDGSDAYDDDDDNDGDFDFHSKVCPYMYVPTG